MIEFLAGAGVFAIGVLFGAALVQASYNKVLSFEGDEPSSTDRPDWLDMGGDGK